MNLEARAANCFSSTFVLKTDGQPIGKYEGRFFSEGVDISLFGRRQLRLDKLNWLGSHFALKLNGDERPLVEADRAGIFTSSWNMKLTEGNAQLVRAGWFNTGYLVQQDGQRLARVDHLGCCERGWMVQGDGALNEVDLLLTGLIYHIIRKRQSRRNSTQ